MQATFIACWESAKLILTCPGMPKMSYFHRKASNLVWLYMPGHAQAAQTVADESLTGVRCLDKNLSKNYDKTEDFS